MLKNPLFTFLLLLLSCTYAKSQEIHIGSPTNGATWHQNSTYNIQWTADANAPDIMRLYIRYDSGGLTLAVMIKDSVPVKAGSFRYKVPANMSEGSMYYLYATKDEFEGDMISDDIKITIAGPEQSGIAHVQDELTESLQVIPSGNGQLKLSCTLPEATGVQLGIYDMSGRQVYTRNSGQQPKGTYAETLVVGDLPAGVYVYHIQAGSSSAEKKLLITGR